MRNFHQVFLISIAFLFLNAPASFGEEYKSSETKLRPTVVLKPGQRKCEDYVLTSEKLSPSLTIYRYSVVSSEIPSVLKFSTENVKASLFKGILPVSLYVNYCVEALPDANPGVYDIGVTYGFFFMSLGKPDFTERLELRIEVE